MPKLVNEIATKVFSRVFRGYDEKEVDAFLDDLMLEIDQYEHEIEKLKKDAGIKPTRSSHANERDSTGEPSISTTAQQMQSARELLNTAIDDAKRIVGSAIEEAESIIANAKAQADAILLNAGEAADETIRQANLEAEAIREEAQQRGSVRASFRSRSDTQEDYPYTQRDPIAELTLRLSELQRRLDSMETENGKVIDFKSAGHRSGAYRVTPGEPSRSETVFSAFGKEDFRTAIRNPWSNWLPDSKTEEPIPEVEVHHAEAVDKDDWNITD